MHGHEHPGAGNEAAGDAVAQADIDKVFRSHVADRGETGFDDGPGIHRRADGLLGNLAPKPIHKRPVPVIVVFAGKMRMRVDESWAEGRVAQVNHPGPLGNWRVCPGRRNLRARDHNHAALDEAVRLAVEQSRGLEDDQFRLFFLARSWR